MADEFKANVGGSISKKEAEAWIEAYDRNHRSDKNSDTKSVFYGRDVLLEILSKDRCAGISFFFASKPDVGTKKEITQLVLVGTKEDGSLMWSEDDGAKEQADSAYDSGTPCPPYCPK